jgi:hypothetical protein
LPKTIPTEGYTCDNRHFLYYGITDSTIHALVANSPIGINLDIQELRCQSCHATFSARRHTAFSHLKTSSKSITLVLAAMAKGLSIAAAVRVFGFAESTITTWLTRAGMHSQRFHRHTVQGLALEHVQLDELRTSLRQKGHEVWLCLALDTKTKLIAAAHLGPRTQASAHALIHSLTRVLAPGYIPALTSDGLNLYFYSLTAYFGTWVNHLQSKKQDWQVAASPLYGQLIKSYRRRKLARVERVMHTGSLDALQAQLQNAGWSGLLQSAFVERVNLTTHRGLAMLARRSWPTAQTVPQLQDGFAWWRAYYYFVKPHESLRLELATLGPRRGKRLSQRYQQRTPAQAAGLTNHRWTVVELISSPVPA